MFLAHSHLAFSRQQGQHQLLPTELSRSEGTHDGANAS